MEVYDIFKTKPSYKELLKIKKEFIGYPHSEIKPAFSDGIKMDESFSVFKAWQSI